MSHKPSRQEKLKAELKLLEWHKLANDAALKVEEYVVAGLANMFALGCLNANKNSARAWTTKDETSR